MKLRLILAISFLVACGLPLAVYWVWPHSRAINSEIERAREQNLLFAQTASATLEVFQQDIQTTFAAVAPSLADGSDVSFALDLLQSRSFLHFCLVNAQTGEVIQALEVTDEDLPAVLPAELMEELRRRAQTPPRLNEVWVSPSGQPRFLLVEDHGDRLIFAGLSTEFVQMLANSVVFGQDGHMAVVDATGRVIAHPNPDWVMEARSLTQAPEIADALSNPAAHVAQFHSPAYGQDVVAGIASVGTSDWRVMVPQPVSEMHATVAAARVSASLVFLAGLALSALVAMVASSLILTPLRRLTEVADDMAAGTTDVRVGDIPRTAPTEIRRLATSFDDMARCIETTLDRITSLAREDASTGLLNKTAFRRAAETWLSTTDARESILLQVDLNNLKSINDVYGHAAGDLAIQRTADRLKTVFPPPSLIGRVGGDEFLVLTSRYDVSDLKDALCPFIHGQPISIENHPNTRALVSCSIGAVRVSDCPEDIKLLAIHADEAMYFAKRSGAGYKLHDDDMKLRSRRRSELAALLRNDVANGQIDVAFQPVFEATSDRILSFETLARWQTAQHGSVQPAEFLSIAEEIGLMPDLDTCVRRKAFALCADLEQSGLAVPIAVNATAADLARTDFVRRFMDDLTTAGLTGECVILEVTEQIFHDKYGLATRTMRELASRGVAIRLDDFGKGFSAHGLLPSFRFDAVKVDMHFAGPPAENKRSAAIVASLIGLGAQLGLAVVVEGIETDEDRRFAVESGAEQLQGFSLGRPMTHAQARARLAEMMASAAAE